MPSGNARAWIDNPLPSRPTECEGSRTKCPGSLLHGRPGGRQSVAGVATAERRLTTHSHCTSGYTQTRQMNQPEIFRKKKKSLSDELFLHFSSKVQNLTVFSIIYMIRIRCFGPGELIQKYFSAAQ